MKKSLVTIVIIMLFLVLDLGGAAAADGQPHSDHDGVTGECAWCHRTHSSGQSSAGGDSREMCLTCHGAGLGANSNVVTGVYSSGRDDSAANEDVGAAHTPDGAALLGGGFVSYKGTPVTSAHDLSCVSCHNPHGSGNYRNLVESINGYTVAVERVDDGPAKDYDSEQWGAGTSSLCIACHQAYGMNASPGGYSHSVGMPYNVDGNRNPETMGYGGYRLPLAQSGQGDLVVCMTCHLPHGSAAQTNSDAGSALLRLDYRAVCQVCHQK